MEKVNLPIEKAQEPSEEARQPLNNKTKAPRNKSNKDKQKKIQNVSFAESPEFEDKPASQNSASYKEALSQPPEGLTQRQRLQWLQKRRNPGLWVQCDGCDRWRHLPHVIDSHELPDKWYCKMNPDASLASCAVPEVPICLREEEDLIHSEYSAGSVVWARLAGWPWWPAMVDDCPDTELFYWLDGFSDIPTHYNVVFFDASEVTRAWIKLDQIKPFSANKKSMKRQLKDNKYKSRLEAALKQAEDADLLPLPERFAKYSFVVRYKGAINKPNKITKPLLKKVKKQLKRKLHIEISDGSSDEDFVEPKEYSKKKIRNSNVIIVGTPKRNKRKNIKPKVLNNVYNEKEQSKILEIEGSEDNTNAPAVEDACNVVANAEQNKNNKEPDSMTVQIGSSEILKNTAETTSTPKQIKGKVNSKKNTEPYECRIASPTSDDFDF